MKRCKTNGCRKTTSDSSGICFECRAREKIDLLKKQLEEQGFFVFKNRNGKCLFVSEKIEDKHESLLWNEEIYDLIRYKREIKLKVNRLSNFFSITPKKVIEKSVLLTYEQLIKQLNQPRNKRYKKYWRRINENEGSDRTNSISL